jgi:hypothetical protein
LEERKLMKIRVCVLAILVLAVLLSGQVSAVMVGPDVIARGGTDAAFQITFIDFGRPSPTSGELTTWYLWAGVSGDVKLQVFRPVTGGVRLVGSNAVTITSIGYNAIPIDPAQRISLQAGDLLGFRYGYDYASDRVIMFDWGGGTHKWTLPWPNDYDVPIGGVVPSEAFAGDEGRTYSLAAEIVEATASLIGTVTLGDYSVDATSIPITVRLIREGVVARTETVFLNSAGQFTVPNVIAGTYDVWIKAAHWLSKLDARASVSGNVDIGAVTLVNGDANGDNAVGLLDLGILKADWGKSPPSNPNADLNGDGTVGLLDLDILKKYWGKSGDS